MYHLGSIFRVTSASRPFPRDAITVLPRENEKDSEDLKKKKKSYLCLEVDSSCINTPLGKMKI